MGDVQFQEFFAGVVKHQGHEQVAVGYPVIERVEQLLPVGLAVFSWRGDGLVDVREVEQASAAPPDGVVLGNGLPDGLGLVASLLVDAHDNPLDDVHGGHEVGEIAFVLLLFADGDALGLDELDPFLVIFAVAEDLGSVDVGPV